MIPRRRVGDGMNEEMEETEFRSVMHAPVPASVSAAVSVPVLWAHAGASCGMNEDIDPIDCLRNLTSARSAACVATAAENGTNDAIDAAPSDLSVSTSCKVRARFNPDAGTNEAMDAAPMDRPVSLLPTAVPLASISASDEGLKDATVILFIWGPICAVTALSGTPCGGGILVDAGVIAHNGDDSDACAIAIPCVGIGPIRARCDGTGTGSNDRPANPMVRDTTAALL